MDQDNTKIVDIDWKKEWNDFPADTLNRAEYAQFLHNYLINRVINNAQ